MLLDNINLEQQLEQCKAARQQAAALVRSGRPLPMPVLPLMPPAADPTLANGHTAALPPALTKGKQRQKRRQRAATQDPPAKRSNAGTSDPTPADHQPQPSASSSRTADPPAAEKPPLPAQPVAPQQEAADTTAPEAAQPPQNGGPPAHDPPSQAVAVVKQEPGQLTLPLQQPLKSVLDSSIPGLGPAPNVEPRPGGGSAEDYPPL